MPSLSLSSCAQSKYAALFPFYRGSPFIQPARKNAGRPANPRRPVRPARRRRISRRRSRRDKLHVVLISSTYFPAFPRDLLNSTLIVPFEKTGNTREYRVPDSKTAMAPVSVGIYLQILLYKERGSYVCNLLADLSVSASNQQQPVIVPRLLWAEDEAEIKACKDQPHVCGKEAACRSFPDNTSKCVCPHDLSSPTSDLRCPNRLIGNNNTWIPFTELFARRNELLLARYLRVSY